VDAEVKLSMAQNSSALHK